MGYEENIGKNIKEVRKAKGLTQRKLYELTGIQDSSISQFEKGRLIPGLDVVSRLASAMGVRIDRLVWGDEDTAYLNKEPNEGKRIVTAVYYLWSMGVISSKDYSYPIPQPTYNNNETRKGTYLGIRKYPAQIMRLLKSLDEIEDNKDSYGDNKDEYVRITLEAVAKDINSKK